MGLRHSPDHIAVEPRDLEPCGGDKLIYAPRKMASAADHALNRIQSPLPLRDRGFVAEAMLEEQERSSRLEHPAHLTQRRRRIGNRAQGEGAYRAVELAVLDW